MGRELTVQNFGSLESKRKYAAGIHASLADISDFEGTPILKLGDDGEWTFGAENIFIEPGDMLAVNPRSLRHGWIAFDAKNRSLAETVDGEAAEVIVPITEPCYFEDLPELEQPKRGEPPVWRKQIVVEVRIVDGPNKGETLVYKPTSVGGRRMLAKLAREIAHRLEEDIPEVVPVIQLFSSTYFNTRFNKEVVSPEMEIDRWLPIDAKSVDHGAEGTEDDDSVATAKVAKKTRGGKAATNGDEPRGRRGSKPEPEPDEDDDGYEDDGADEEQPRGRGRPAAARGRRPKEDAEPRGRRSAAVRDMRDDDGEDAETEQPRRGRRDSVHDEGDERDAEPRGRGRRARPAADEDGDEDHVERRGGARPGRRAAPVDRDDDRVSRRGRAEDGRRAAGDRDGRTARRSADEDDAADGVRGRRASAGGRSSREAASVRGEGRTARRRAA